MSTPNRVDTSTLEWVKDEIDQTLDQAREALQRYIDEGDDLTPLRLFANNLHQVAPAFFGGRRKHQPDIFAVVIWG